MNYVTEMEKTMDKQRQQIKELKAQLAEANARAERWKTLAGQSAMSDFNTKIDNKILRAALEAFEAYIAC